MAIETIAVIGGGTMGVGIAHAAAAAGYKAHVRDIDKAILDQARSVIAGVFEGGAKRGKLTEKEAEAAMERLAFTTSLEKALGEADLVIEAVPENIGLKLETFRDADEVCPAETLFASNTSALSITEMGAGSGRPDRFVGMHFFNPVWKMKLVEVVRGLDTAQETVDIALEVSRKMGKKPIEVRESPGFVTTRLNAMIGNEAMYMLQEGVASPRDIDRATKLGLNHPMGPLELGDLVGWDTRLKILKYLHRSLGEKYRPCPLIEQYVAAGRLGRKTGRGIYDYPEN